MKLRHATPTTLRLALEINRRGLSPTSLAALVLRKPGELRRTIARANAREATEKESKTGAAPPTR